MHVKVVFALVLLAVLSLAHTSLVEQREKAADEQVKREETPYVACDNGTSVCPSTSTCCHHQYSPSGWGCTVNSTCCLLGPAKPPSTTLPNCLVLGDSVSIGYTPHVIAHLSQDCLVQHTPWDVSDGGAGSTGYGLACLEIFLKTAAQQSIKWDVIHFNFGLHNLNNDTAAEELYAQQLANITDRLMATGAKLQYGTTTPFMPDYLVGNQVVEQLNTNARAIMDARKVGVVDLYQRVVQYCGPLPYKSCKICRLDPCSAHYTSDGSEYISLPIVEGIKALLRESAIH